MRSAELPAPVKAAVLCDALPYIRDALELEWVPEPMLADHYPAYAPPLTGHYFNQRKTTIYAGSTEIQKNIISKMVLGL